MSIEVTINIAPLLARIDSRLLALIWPPCCVLCGRAGRVPDIDLCSGCEGDLPRNEHCCRVCAQPFTGESVGELVCGSCLKQRPRFDASVSPFRYAYPLDHMIRRLKYGRTIVHGRVLGELFARAIGERREPWPEAVVPVPLAMHRYRERGYNQALVLAEHVASQLNLPLRTDLVERTRETLVQAGLDQRARRKNVRHAFRVCERLALRHVAIFDDVVTTGSTANELARVLKRAGAKRVEVWSIARAGRA